ncbi:MAG: GatB/YqeY domain-containing protein, partial [Anaerolineales bacterium]
FLVGGTGLYLSSVLQNYQLKKSDFNSNEYHALSNLDFKTLKDMLLEFNLSLHNTTDLTEKERIIKAILIEKAEAEIAVVSEFLPQPLSREELRALVAETISESGASSISDMGKVMGLLMPKIRGKADGKEANQLVRELLSGD